MRFTYDGAPARCRFPPHLWQPGCPTKIEHHTGTVETLSYGPDGGLTTYLEWGPFSYGKDGSVRAKGVSYLRRGGMIESARRDGDGLDVRVLVDARGRPTRSTLFDRGGASKSKPLAEVVWTYRDDRAVSRVMTSGSIVEDTAYDYDCN